jgi:hypothetical protein
VFVTSADVCCHRCGASCGDCWHVRRCADA